MVDFRQGMGRQVKIIVEKHPDGYVAYPLGLKGVVVGEGALVGIGANVIPERTIGAWSVVGAGATVIEDVPERATVVGVPARVVKSRVANSQPRAHLL